MLFAILLGAFLQDDPAVLYREALFDEVDRGDLDKAVKTYEKILNLASDAPTKARAMFRRGFCLEKLGRKKEAEQAYRDVIAQFPDEDAAKQARGRAASRDADTGPGSASQINVMILDLGSEDDKVRSHAIRKLTLFGSLALPELKRALAHKDPRLSVGAARVLVNVEEYDGIYDALMRALAKSYDQEPEPFAGLLNAREDDRKRFVRDSSKMAPETLDGITAALSPPLKDPIFQRQLETRLLQLVGPDDETPSLARPWMRGTEAPELARFIRVLSGKKKYDVILALLSYAPAITSGEVSDAVLDALKGFNHDQIVVALYYLQHYVDHQALYSQVYPSLLARPQIRKRVADAIADTHSVDDRDFQTFAVDLITSPEYPEDIKHILLADRGKCRIVDEYSPRLSQYLIEYLKVIDPVRRTEWSFSRLAARYVIDYPPKDTAIDAAFDILVWSGELDKEIKARRPDEYSKAALRALSTNSPNVRKNAVEVLLRCGFPTDPVQVARVVLPLAQEPMLIDPSTHLIRSSVGWLAANQRAELMTEMIRLLGGSQTHKEVRLFAAELIASHGTSAEKLRTLPALLAVLNMESDLKPEDLFRSALRPKTVHKIGDLLREALLASAPKERSQAVKEIIPILTDRSKPARVSLLYDLAGIDAPELDDLMSAALKDTDAVVRRCAIRHWSAVKKPGAVDKLLRALVYDVPENLREAMEGLAANPSLDAVPRLIDYLQSPDARIRSAALDTLKQIKKYYDEDETWRKWYKDKKQSREK